MKAIIVQNSEKNTSLGIEHRKNPEPGPKEILVNIMATALNRADLLQRRGLYAPPKNTTPVLGLEMAGTVEKCGSGVTKWQQGDPVFGLLPGGGYAEYCVIHEDLAMPKPENLAFNTAAAIPETFLTAYQALNWLGELKKDEHILIHAGGSGVGTSAIQLARLVTPKIYITAGKPEKIERCKQLGAKEGINYKQQQFDEVISNLTNNRGVDVIIDFIGAKYWKMNINSLSINGRLVLLALMGGHKLSSESLIPFMKKNLTVRASTLRARPIEYKIALTRAFCDRHLQQIEKEIIKPEIDSLYSWKDAEKAHRRMAENRNTGKIVLEID